MQKTRRDVTVRFSVGGETLGDAVPQAPSLRDNIP